MYESKKINCNNTSDSFISFVNAHSELKTVDETELARIKKEFDSLSAKISADTELNKLTKKISVMTADKNHQSEPESGSLLPNRSIRKKKTSAIRC